MNDSITATIAHSDRRWWHSLSNLQTVAILVAIVLAVALVTELVGSRTYDRVVIRMMIDLTLVLGLQMFMGNTNILWFPHVGFMGIGAYTSVIFTMSPVQKLMSLPDIYPLLENVQVDFLPALIIGGLVAAFVAIVIGLPLMRLSDFPAVIAGFALLVVIHVILSHWSELTNGPQTLFGVTRETYLFESTLAACLFILVAFLFKESKVGMQLRASRDDLVAAPSTGINVIRVRYIAFILSAFTAGIGGGLYAHYITSFTPDAFFLAETFILLAMLVIGGPATVTGAVIGALLVSTMRESLRFTENALNSAGVMGGNIVGLTSITLAVLMILILIMRPNGLIERNEIRFDSLRKLLPGARERS